MIAIAEPSLTSLEREYLLRAIDSGWISSQGEFISEFEEQFARWNQMPYATACSNCTTALHLALDVLGIGPGDEVLCPDLTFIAPANMIRLTRAGAGIRRKGSIQNFAGSVRMIVPGSLGTDAGGA